MHHAYIVPGVIDGAVVHKQADARLHDRRSPGETVVHAHRKGFYCNDDCRVYTFPKIECSTCKGFGNIKTEGALKKCETCNGRGEVNDPNWKP